MLLTQLINKGVEAISALYPEGEAKEMVYAFLEHHIGTKRYTHIVEPGHEVAQEKALQAQRKARDQHSVQARPERS